MQKQSYTTLFQTTNGRDPKKDFSMKHENKLKKQVEEWQIVDGERSNLLLGFI